MRWITTTVMLDRLESGQEEAWDEFVSHFTEPVRRFALRLGLNDAQADDVAQNTMLAFVRGLRENRYERGRGRLSSWLFGIAYREAARAARDGRADQQGPDRTGRTTFFSAQPDERAALRTWTEDWDRFVLDRCLERARGEVEPRTFEAFELVAIRRVPAAEVADQLGMTRNAVFVAKHRVLRRVGELQREFEGAPGGDGS